MSASVAEQVIERSAQDVWAYAADIVRHAKWMTVTRRPDRPGSVDRGRRPSA